LGWAANQGLKDMAELLRQHGGLTMTGSEASPHIMAQEPNEDSYDLVMRLFNEFEHSGNISALKSLANLVHNDRFGPNAAGALTLLARKVTREQAESVIIPALVGGLSSTNIAIRRGVAIALSDYSPYVAPVVPALINFLNNSQQMDKLNADYFAINALGGAGREASPAIPTLLKIIDWPETNWDSLGDISPRAAALAAIDRIGFSDSTTRLRLEKALSDRSPHVECAAASALIDNKCVSEAALVTLSRTIVTNDITFALEPVTLDLIRDATTNVNPSIQGAARTLLKKVER